MSSDAFVKAFQTAFIIKDTIFDLALAWKDVKEDTATFLEEGVQQRDVP